MVHEMRLLQSAILGESTDDELREEVAAVKSETLLKSGNVLFIFFLQSSVTKHARKRILFCRLIVSN